MFRRWREIFGGNEPVAPTNSGAAEDPKDRSAWAIRYDTAMAAARALAGALKPGERESLDPKDLTMGRATDAETATIQGAFTLDQLPQMEPALENGFRVHLHGLVEALLAHPDGIAVREDMYVALEGVADRKGTNLISIVTMLTGKAVVRNGTILQLLSDEEATLRVRGR